uniref:Bulb-type lectin domain-containing protein n=1 Tax=Labrus bergylta TaxID=56723 RepID=A0A3Q3F9G4_9LABR
MSRNYLSRNNELRKGDYLMSNNNMWKAVFEVRGKKKTMVTLSSMDLIRLCMQTDSNLVKYNESGTRSWSTGTHTDSEDFMCRLQLTDRGMLALYGGPDDVWNNRWE